ncbi:hypothetical protein FEM48_Zijuj09G0221900 [Ziziphus jujuba var. spinosa]|uniref:Transmembrane protein n=1 Tax=Ziziphus jujuba var. spinosa TaxID=714518 RepID=A0A978UVL6_ZIZJJ|nr:uncharacterized protein LOC107427931 [Ziziphus jujuba var. spinosa]KAH7518916.1 hypothetical protein FEM48_Zijuj09G0221900 [Ziziphus jujuba var. spinosa]
MRTEDQQSRILYDLTSMIIAILKSPPLPCIPIPTPYTGVGVEPSSPSSRINVVVSQTSSPTSFASLFLGISLALMLFGSVTFVIGFLLIPFVIGLVMVFYVFEIVSNLSQLGRSILLPPCVS